MIEALTAAEATERLRAEGLKISPETVRHGIQQGVFPFGDCVTEDGKVKWCYIYGSKLDAWIRDRQKYPPPVCETGRGGKEDKP